MKPAICTLSIVIGILEPVLAAQDSQTNAPLKMASYEQRISAIYPVLGRWLDPTCSLEEYTAGCLEDLRLVADKDQYVRHLEAIASAWKDYSAKHSPTQKQQMLASGLVFGGETWDDLNAACMALPPEGRDCLSTNQVIELVTLINAECDKRSVKRMTNGVFRASQK